MLRDTIKSFHDACKISYPKICPSCNIHTTFSSSIIDIGSNTELRSAKCSNCKQIIVDIRTYQNIQLAPRFSGRGGPRLELERQETNWIMIYPTKIIICSDERIPKELRAILNEAASTIGHSR